MHIQGGLRQIWGAGYRTCELCLGVSAFRVLLLLLLDSGLISWYEYQFSMY
jgi:hypothetical protein